MEKSHKHIRVRKKGRMKLKFYGGANEVGRSCISVDDTFLFDAGLKISEEGSEYPLQFDPETIRAVFLSHAHLDHCGALPLLNRQGLRCSVFCNSMTKELSKLLMKDSLHIEMLTNQHPEYNKENITNIMSFMQNVNYNKEYKANGAKFTFYYAGHIPGSASVLVEVNGKRIFYTGDINSSDTRLMSGAQYDNLRNVDVMISEATYGDRSHPSRDASENDFLDSVTKTINDGGSVIIPAFAVGRAQEIIMLLAKRKLNVPIYLDGMAKKVCNVLQKKPEFIKNSVELKKSLEKVKFVKNWRERKELAGKRGIFVTTSGMLDGGPVLDYLKYLYHDEKSSVLLTGYQAEDSNGRLLLDQGKVYLDGNRIKVRCNVKKYDFSAHSGKKELMWLIDKIRPKTLVLNHGDPEAIESLAGDFRNKMDVHCPKVGDSIKV